MEITVIEIAHPFWIGFWFSLGASMIAIVVLAIIGIFWLVTYAYSKYHSV